VCVCLVMETHRHITTHGYQPLELQSILFLPINRRIVKCLNLTSSLKKKNAVKTYPPDNGFTDYEKRDTGGLVMLK